MQRDDSIANLLVLLTYSVAVMFVSRVHTGCVLRCVPVEADGSWDIVSCGRPSLIDLFRDATLDVSTVNLGLACSALLSVNPL